MTGSLTPDTLREQGGDGWSCLGESRFFRLFFYRASFFVLSLFYYVKVGAPAAEPWASLLGYSMGTTFVISV